MKKLLPVILIIVLLGLVFVFYKNASVNSNPQDNQQDSQLSVSQSDNLINVNIQENENLQTDLVTAFKQKHPDWDMSTIKLEVDENDGNFIKGKVVPVEAKGGGGIFFAANTTNGWVIASDGNGVVFCEDIEPYNFPTNIIPQCYDAQTSTVVERL